ncbi:hypothetical protein QNI19_15500 [Cytophagaceae bacterium DM2B3-1]|uniref:Uncharacterized protein n=1 Tax=Xanthocytophaga flava TaxID=3048013 RepID=A0AAE3U7S9_9BACT|nr:hypothetical protein [Xanthocytophaga flavus]MDJ1483239.1 hypothetical protein [Xanthocytophaga flavus]MDJ1494348.1 hypothetical protein [Xanthocytophaga flavus]
MTTTVNTKNMNWLAKPETSTAEIPSFVGKKWKITSLALGSEIDSFSDLLSNTPQSTRNDIIVFQPDGRLKGEYGKQHEQVFNWTYDTFSNVIQLFGDQEFETVTGLKILELTEETLRAVTKIYENGLSLSCIITLTALCQL